MFIDDPSRPPSNEKAVWEAADESKGLFTSVLHNVVLHIRASYLYPNHIADKY
jgi:hypothetical protein